MSNIVDYTADQNLQRYTYAITGRVYIDGELCTNLAVREIGRSGYPEFSKARLMLINQRDVARLEIGQAVRIETCCWQSEPTILFEGHITGALTSVDHAGEHTEYIAEDISFTFKKINVHGRRISAGNSSIVQEGAETCFNADGIGNAAVAETQVEHRSYTLFASSNESQAQWSAAEAIIYLLNEYAGDASILIPEKPRLEAICKHAILTNIDVTGMNLIEALQKCCRKAGIEFEFVRPEGCRNMAICFYSPKLEKSLLLLNAERDESALTVCEIKRKIVSKPVAQRYRVQGDYKMYEGTFELIKAWDTALETTDYNALSPSMNPHFDAVRDVYRKWCLNEAGDYSGTPFLQGGAYDFSSLFGHRNYMQTRRRFWPSLSCDETGKSLGYYLQVSYDGGAHWWEYLHAFKMILDECGVWLCSDHLDMDTWWAALKGSLRLRVTACVLDDERISYTATSGKIGSMIEEIDYVITEPRKYQFKKVSPKSIFFGNEAVSGRERDDSCDVVRAAQHYAKTPIILEEITIDVPRIICEVRPGDHIISNEEDRRLDMAKERRCKVIVQNVMMDFKTQITKITAKKIYYGYQED